MESLARLHPDFNRDDFRRGAAAKYWDTLVACSGPEIRTAGRGPRRSNQRRRAQYTPAADRLRRYLAEWALPQKRLSAPLYVWYGGTDTFIDASWTAGAIERACALGGPVVTVFEKDKGHGKSTRRTNFSGSTIDSPIKPVMNACA